MKPKSRGKGDSTPYQEVDGLIDVAVNEVNGVEVWTVNLSLDHPLSDDERRELEGAIMAELIPLRRRPPQ